MWKATIGFVMSVRPHGTIRLPLYGFSWNLMYIFSKTCRENSNFTKAWQEWRVLYMKTCVRLWHRTKFFLKWRMSQIKGVEKKKKRFITPSHRSYHKEVSHATLYRIYSQRRLVARDLCTLMMMVIMMTKQFCGTTDVCSRKASFMSSARDTISSVDCLYAGLNMFKSNLYAVRFDLCSLFGELRNNG